MTDVDLVAELPIIQRLAAALGTELDRASVVALLRGNVAHSGVLVGSRGRPKPLAPPVHQQLAAQRCGCRALRLQPRAQGQQQSSTTVLSAQVTDATTAKPAKPPQIGSPVKPCTSREALRAMRTCEYSGAHRRREQSRMGAIRESHSRRHSFRNKRRRLCPARQPAGLGASSEATYQH